MDYKKANTLSNIIFAAALVAALFLFVFDDASAGFYITIITSLALMICGIVIKVKFYRCPYCSSLLPFRSAVGTFCRHCGKQLEPWK